MFLSELLFDKPTTAVYNARPLPEYSSACPPLRSIPGVICNTSNIWEYVLDIASMTQLKKSDIIYPDVEDLAPIIYLKKGKMCINQFNEEGKVFIPHFIFSGALIYDAFFITDGQYQTMPIKALEDSELYVFPKNITFEDILNINPQLIKNLIYSQAVKNLCYSKMSCINMYVKPLNRVCMFIYEMYKTHQKKNYLSSHHPGRTCITAQYAQSYNVKYHHQAQGKVHHPTLHQN